MKKLLLTTTITLAFAAQAVAPKDFNDAKLKKGVLTVAVPAKSIVVLNIK